jgi:UDP-glucose:glycoprotein glucosyltransferase
VGHSLLQEEVEFIQQEFYYGRLRDRMDILDFALRQDSHSRYSPLVLGGNVPGAESTERYVSLAGPVADQTGLVPKLPYLHHPGTADDVKPVTHWVVVNLGERKGLRVLKQAMAHLADKSSAKSRVAVLLAGDQEPSVLERVVLAALQVRGLAEPLVGKTRSCICWEEIDVESCF